MPGLRDAARDWSLDKTVIIRVPLAMVRDGMLAAVLKDLGELTLDVDNGRAQVTITAE